MEEKLKLAHMKTSGSSVHKKYQELVSRVQEKDELIEKLETQLEKQVIKLFLAGTHILPPQPVGKVPYDIMASLPASKMHLCLSPPSQVNIYLFETVIAALE